jgi:hypothetical protein
MNIKFMIDAAGYLATAISMTIDPAERSALAKIRRALLKVLKHHGIILGEGHGIVEETGKE